MIGGTGHDGDDIGGVVAVHVDDALPYRCRCSWVVRRARDVVKGEVICLPLHRFGESLSAPYIGGDCTEHRTRRTRKNRGTERTLHALCGVILLPVPHLMGEDNGDLILVIEVVVKPCIDAHIMSERTECVEAVLVVDEIEVRTVVDGRVLRTDRRRQIGEDAVELIVERVVVIDPILFAQLIVQRLTTLFRRIVVLYFFVHLSGRRNTADDSTDDVARAGLGHRRGTEGNTARHGDGESKCDTASHQFFLIHNSS